MKAVIIGTGVMGRRHIGIAQRAGFDVVGIADPLAESLQKAKAEYNLSDATLFEDYKKLLSETSVDLVVVSTTAPSHAEITCFAATQKVKYILCEKPMATSIAECKLMLETCKSNGVTLAINHQMQFMEQYSKTKEMLESEELGGLKSMTIVAGNFGIAMNGSHYLEAFRYLTNSPVVSVSAWFSEEKVPNPRGAQFEDRAGIIKAKNKNGQRFLLECSADQGFGASVIYSAARGQIYIDEGLGYRRFERRKAEHRDLPTTRYFTSPELTEEMIAPADNLAPTQKLLESMIAGKDFCTGERGLSVVAALVAAYESNASNHKEVLIDDTLPAGLTFPWA